MNVRAWLPRWSVPAAMRAIRAMVCVCGLFALSDKVIGNPQIATFAAFGSFATLVLASFAGTWRDKLLAHLALALTGSVLLTIATLVSSSTVLAAIVTVPVTFAVFFAGVTGPNAASGALGALLAWVLPAASLRDRQHDPRPARSVGGWRRSAAPPRCCCSRRDRAAATSCSAAASALAGKLADVLDAAVRGGPTKDDLAAMIAAKHELIARFTSTPYRPTGLAATDQALANCVELLEWTEDSDLRRGRGAARPPKRAGARPRSHRHFKLGAARRPPLCSRAATHVPTSTSSSAAGRLC